jgi:hypothetical protein
MRFIYVVICVCALLGGETQAQPPQIILKDGKFAYDVEQNLYWRRCSFGQAWVDETCKGDIKKLSLEDALSIASKLSKVDGKTWRLPTREELSGLIQNKPGYPQIDQEIFPNTYPGPYWTATKNYFDPSRSWTVNFFTGQFFSRFLNSQEQAVRFVTNKN